MNVDHDAFAVDIGDLECAQLGSPQPCGVQSHEDCAVHQIAGGVDQSGNLVLAEDGRQRALPLREWNMVRQIRPSECLNEEKPQGGPSLLDGAWGELKIAKQMNLIGSDVLRPQQIRTLVEVCRKLLDGADIASYCILGVVSTLEFIQHHFS